MKVPPVSYTFHKNYENCPRKAYRVNIAKDIPRQETEAMRWGNAVDRALADRINKGTPLPEAMASYEKFCLPLTAARAKFKMGIRENGESCDFFAPDVWARGEADVVVAGESAALILDWKTGKPREDADELEQHAVLWQAFTHGSMEKITGHYVWLREPRLGRAHDLSATDQKLEAMRVRQAEIEKAFAERWFPPRQNPLCGWCPVRDCEFNTSGAR